jgi:hypothetical protein
MIRFQIMCKQRPTEGVAQQEFFALAGRASRAARVLFLLCLALLVACGNVSTMGKKGRGNAFVETVEGYGKMLRWGYYDEAVGLLRNQDGSAVDSDPERVARYRISSYDIKSQLLSDTGAEGRVIVRIEYYDIDSGVLRTLDDAQSWWFDQESRRWFLASPLPNFGARKKSAEN